MRSRNGDRSFRSRSLAILRAVAPEDLRARIATVLAYLKTFTPADFDGAATRVVALPFVLGKGLRGDDYLRELAAPNFYFHVTTAYSILRHNGVVLGKANFIGSLNLYDA